MGKNIEKPGEAPLSEGRTPRLEFGKPAPDILAARNDASLARGDMERVRQRGENAIKAMEFEAALQIGEIDSNNAQKEFDNRLVILRKSAKRGFVLMPEVVSGMRAMLNSARKDREKRTTLSADLAAALDRRNTYSQAKMLALLGRQIPIAEEKKIAQAVKEFEEKIPEHYEKSDRKDQMRVAEEIVAAYNLKIPAEKMRAYILYYEKQKDDAQFVSVSLKDEKFVNALVKKSAAISDADKLFDTVLRQTRQQDYNAYRETWRSRNVADVFAPLSGAPPSLPGAPVNLASEAAQTAIREMQNTGVEFHPLDGGRAQIQVGILAREVFFRAADGGKIKLFIEDRDADRGVRGPIDPADARKEMRNVQMDNYFSNRIREFSTVKTENDPSKIPDKDLKEIVRKFLPKEDTIPHGQDLETQERRILDNLARLLVNPDERFKTMKDRAYQLKRITANPEKLAAAKRRLQSTDATGLKIFFSNLE